jgi:GNAT superfamily N-acetyltransferase
VIRPYRLADYDGISDVCVQTAEGGGDARGRYSSDELMPDIFAGPYARFAPELAFVVDDGSVGGYILGVADTRAFVDWYSREWLPGFAEKYTHVEPWDDKNGLITHLGFWPERMLIPEVDDYPAHLHIDLLPRLQGRGLGRELIAVLSDALRARGVPGLHLTMDAANTPARAFYDRLGFVELPSSTADAPVLGIRL